MKSVYLHDWAVGTKEQLIRNFDITDKELKGAKILLASYSYEDYSGHAFVLFIRDNHLYEVHGSHCSCYGLGGQWQPEISTIESLEYRLQHGTIGDYGHGSYRNELEAVVKKLKKYQIYSVED